jgi:MoxR-like ATPase
MRGVETAFHYGGTEPPTDPWAELRANRAAEDEGEPLGPSEVADLRDALTAEVSKAVIGQEHAIELMMVAAIAGGHVLVEGPPGVAKTLLSNALAHALGISFNRIQFTPDTTPSHIAGKTIEQMGEPVFLPGPVFTNILLADEINRTPPRTQAALLEAMQEKQVTVDGKTHWLPNPFIVIATQNSLEQHGVFPLPEAQLDRFLFKVHIDYGDESHEIEMLNLPHAGLTPDLMGEIHPLMGSAKLTRAQREVDRTNAPQDLVRYVVRIVRETRAMDDVTLGASPRAAIHLLAAAKACARLGGRDHVIYSDVDEMALPVLGHRIIVEGRSPAEIVAAAVAAVNERGGR